MGARTHRYFHLFLAWTTLSIAAFFARTVPWQFWNWPETCSRNSSTLPLVVLVGVGVLVAGLEVFHIFLLLTNRTTIELLGRTRHRAPVGAAVREVFGEDPRAVLPWWEPSIR